MKEGAIDEKSPVVLGEDEIGVVRGTVAAGDGDRGFDIVEERRGPNDDVDGWNALL